MPVDRCICHQIRFSDIKKIANMHGMNSIEQLRAKKICCAGCKLCEPYIKKLLQSGETTFQPIVKAD